MVEEGRKKMITVLAHGCFDILHVGHVLHLQQASKLGDCLVVSITAGRHITKEGRPVFSDDERARMLWALRCVDRVYICDEPTGVTAIKDIRPDLYVKGVDYEARGVNSAERQACVEVGAKIVYTQTQKYSSRELLRHFK